MDTSTPTHTSIAKLSAMSQAKSHPAEEIISRVGEYSKNMKKILLDVKKISEDENKMIEDQKLFVEGLINLKTILGDIPGNVLDIYANTTKQVTFLKTELNTRNSSQFEKPFASFMEKVEQESAELVSMKKK
jgi:hypothetical protein